MRLVTFIYEVYLCFLLAFMIAFTYMSMYTHNLSRIFKER